MDGIAPASIPPLVLHESTPREQINAESLVTNWLHGLKGYIETDSFGALPSLFIEDCWWRDITGLSWDFTTKHGWDDIASYLRNAPSKIEKITPAQSDSLKAVLLDIGGMVWIQAGFEFTTAYGQGRGLLKLINVGPSQWKAWSVFTQLEKLHCGPASPSRGPGALIDGQQAANVYAEHASVLPTPPSEGTDSADRHNGNGIRQTPQVVIIGAGQCGLALGARLRRMGISALLIERNRRLGDSWRKRYKSIRLHTPSYTDSYPFLDFPEDWPKFPSRDMIADFAEQYGQRMGLDVWLNTNVMSLEYDAGRHEWQVELQQPEGSRSLKSKHVVLATGVYADEPIIPDFPGQEDFNGQIYHSSQHESATQVSNVEEKKVVVIGAGPSAHDVAQDFANHKAKAVSMVQRQAIFSMSMEAMENVIFFLWNIPGLSTEDADLIGNSTPIAVIRAMSIGMTKAMAEQDKDMIAGLKKAGLALKTGDDGYGVADHQLIKGGQYYIDQGANQIIIDGRIGIHQCSEGISHFEKTGVSLSDGRHVDADVVVLATGYNRNLTTVKKLLGAKAAEALKGFGDLDHEQERSGWWRNTSLPGFWYMTGSFMWARQFSLPLALQIAAVEHGLNKSYYLSKYTE